MLARWQVVVLIVMGAVFWLVAAVWVRWFPLAFTDPIRGTIGFVTTIPIGWLSVLFTRRVAHLSREQLLTGVSVASVVAMLLDAVALRWSPSMYAPTDAIIRFASAWLLWGYGVSLGFAVMMGSRAGGSRLG
jgi:hypothetical protein